MDAQGSKKIKSILITAGVALAAYVALRVLTKGESIKTAVEKTAEKIMTAPAKAAEAPEKVVEAVKPSPKKYSKKQRVVYSDKKIKKMITEEKNSSEDYKSRGMDKIVKQEANHSKKLKKIKKVMTEFKKGKLKTPAGKKVVKRKQAVAIAMTKAGQENHTSRAE